MSHFKKHVYKTNIALLSFIAACIWIAAFLKYANADISNPHPTPPSNSVTTAMIQNGAITPALISSTGAFTFASSTHYVGNFGVFTATTSASLPASVTINGVGLTFPSTQCGNNQVWQNNGSGTLSCVTVVSSRTATNFTAGEAISQGAVVAYGDGAQTTFNSNAQSGQSTHVGSTITSTTWEAIATTTPATNAVAIVSVNPCFRDASPPENATIQVDVEADSAGHPSGVSLGTKTLTFSNANGGSGQTFTLTSITNINPNTTYWIVMQDPTNTGQPQLCTATGTALNRQESTNSGGTWSGSTADSGIGIVWEQNDPTKVYNGSSLASNFRLKDIIGFAETAAASGATLYVSTSGIAPSPTSTTMGTSYFVNDTNGTIGTSAGTNSRKVGTGLGTNGFLINIALQ